MMLPDPFVQFAPVSTGRINPSGPGGMGVFRLPTDPLFTAPLTLENIVVGSRYRVTRASNGAELALGVASSTSEVIPTINVYSNPMVVNITVRNASGSPAYRIFDTVIAIGREGATAYILQQQDE